MIELTRLNHKKIFINPDLMKSIEETPDTIIGMANGDQYLVLEKPPEIIEKIIDFRVAVVRRADNPGSLVKVAPPVEGA
ncbi:MAG: flagellar FlbD family protein [Desulforhopalus sp.]|nr:flagellar FlbD family protein [Desulforhopalus sp.]